MGPFYFYYIEGMYNIQSGAWFTQLLDTFHKAIMNLLIFVGMITYFGRILSMTESIDPIQMALM